MNKQFKMVPLALAIASLCMTGTVMANGDEGGGHDGKRHDREGASISKVIKVKKDVEYKGRVKIEGTIEVDSLGMAVIDDKQESEYNFGYNKTLDNTSALDNNAMRNARGNIGVNISAGDNNVQGNSAALAAADADFVFGSGDAEIFVDQDAKHNFTWNEGVTNKATIGGNALRNARGNIGVNVASGNNNIQKNAFAGSTTSGSMSEATVVVNQSTKGNITKNLPVDEMKVTTTTISMSGGLRGGYVGVGAGGYSGEYQGTSDQIGNVYPDIWSNPASDGGVVGDQHDVHPTSQSLIAHMDLDTQTEGGLDLNNDGGALAFRESGTESGDLGFVEVGKQWLSGSFSGSVQHYQHVYISPENKAKVDGNSLRNARGNIGVNVAAGTNNLQNNSLAISHLSGLMMPGMEPEPPAGGGGE